MSAGRYNYAVRGVPGWSASAEDGSSSTSGYRGFAEVADDLAPGAYIVDLTPLFDADGFVSAVVKAPMHGTSERGAFVDALRDAPWMMAPVAAYGMLGATADSIKAQAEGTYGPMDYAPAEYLAGYWADRGALVSRAPDCEGCPCIEQGDLGACCICGVDVDAHAEVQA